MSETYELLLPFADPVTEDEARQVALNTWRLQAEQAGEVTGEPEAELLGVMQDNGRPLLYHDEDGNPTQPAQAWRVTGQVIRHAE
jgi:hypothetical protein